MKKILIGMFLLGTLISASAQVPSYVPSNGLVGWWPFNGNANDESGNGNNGTVNGTVLTSDRYGANAKAMLFNNSISSYISIPYNSKLSSLNGTLCAWLNTSSDFGGEQRFVFGQPFGQPQFTVNGNFCNQKNKAAMYFSNLNPSGDKGICSNSKINTGNWIFIVATYSPDSMNIYIDGIKESSIVFPSKINANVCNASLFIGGYVTNSVCGFGSSSGQFYNGKIDDLGMWNRALNSTEIKDLYNGCKVFISTEPTNQTSIINGQAQFTLTVNDTTSLYQWQSNASNMGWSNIPLSSFYSGVTSKKLTVSDIQVNNHKQLFRVIASKNSCKDTSAVAMLTVNDTCITSTTDTLHIKVNTSSSSNPVFNTIRVYPNPSSTQVVIDNGNYTTMGSYTTKIVNAAGQLVFQSVINKQQFVIDTNTMGGTGVYTLYIIDANSKVVGVKKIVLQ